MLNSSVKPCPAYCQNRGQMTQNGRTANTSLAPAPRGNRRAAKHFAYATFTPAELEEVGALEDELRALCRSTPRRSNQQSRPWPARCGGGLSSNAYVDQTGITRGRADRMRQLAMLPRE